jgi:hypothetical protein
MPQFLDPALEVHADIDLAQLYLPSWLPWSKSLRIFLHLAIYEDCTTFVEFGLSNQPFSSLSSF